VTIGPVILRDTRQITEGIIVNEGLPGEFPPLLVTLERLKSRAQADKHFLGWGSKLQEKFEFGDQPIILPVTKLIGSLLTSFTPQEAIYASLFSADYRGVHHNVLARLKMH
jgi:hypothetical protein